MDRSEIKKACRRARQPMGVYGIRNSRDETVFVGFATDLNARINRHRAELKFGSHRNQPLQEKWDLYGEPAFVFEILEVLDREGNSSDDPVEDLRLLAGMWIEKLREAGGLIVNLNR